MIDYVKILLINIDISRLLNLSLLDFKTEVSENTGELSTKRVSEYHFCKIIVYDTGLVYFSGSIHKLWNSLNKVTSPNFSKSNTYKGYNGNIFFFHDIVEVRNHLKNIFDCSSKQMIFQNIEFGSNLNLSFKTQTFISGLLFHKGKLFEFKYDGYYAQVRHQRYFIKIYNKGNQYGMEGDIIRIELKIKKTEELKCLGIKTFYDINTSTLIKAAQLIYKRFEEVVHYDHTIDTKKLNSREKQAVNKYSNPNYWAYQLKPKERDRHKKRLARITDKNSLKLHSRLLQKLEEKCVIINRQSKQSKCVIINPSNIGVIVTQKELRKCPITGISLEHESNTANYIRTTTLRYLKRNNQKLFFELCSLLLSNNGRRPKYENSIVSHLAKQIRNRYYNSFKIRRQGYRSKTYQDQYKIVF
ncbi:hypothetical protein V8G61_10315 [Gaetbulibacter sp. M240]|uniref:hypothetical protein n=1 Tax=Gaetbulibacter sp. M240 TaxID=3126511 RepID=UPI00374FA5D9